MDPETLTVDVVQDTVCPWCRIGKANLDAALRAWDGPPVVLRWHPFELDPTIPPEGMDFRTKMAAKMGRPASELGPVFDRVRQAGAGTGLSFDFDRIGRAPNTLRSHALIAGVPAAVRDAVIDAIHAAYFEEGRDIGDPETLVAVAAGAGVPEDEARAILADPDALAAVREEAAGLSQSGISGVPFFVFGGTHALSGAQPPAALLAAMRQAAAD